MKYILVLLIPPMFCFCCKHSVPIKDYECADSISENVGCEKWEKLPGYTEDVTIHSDGSIETVSGPVAITPCRRKIEEFCIYIIKD